MNRANTTITTGLGFGCVLAMIISWSHTTSILWTLFHGLLGWIYVVISLLNGNAHLL